jgi:single-strand DNA-binding protein
MKDVNSLTIIGRLTRDPELKNVGEYALCNFSIANNGFKENEVNFFDVVVWGKLGELVEKYCEKGKQVCITGELVQERWEKDGSKRSAVKIKANNVQFLGSDKNKENKKSKYDGFEDNPGDEDISF